MVEDGRAGATLRNSGVCCDQQFNLKCVRFNGSRILHTHVASVLAMSEFSPIRKRDGARILTGVELLSETENPPILP